jgi:phospholipid/cholesterol/gamma-HCH transport system substrate-binding protein
MPPQAGKPFERATREDILYAASGGSVEETFITINKLSTRVERVFDEVGDVFQILGEAKFWDNLTSGAQSFKEIATAANNPEEIKSTLDNLHTFSGNLKDSWKKIDKGVEDIAKAAEGFMDIASLAKDLFKTIDEGNGSIGAILKKDDFYLQLKSIMSKVETLMNDINHYGILYSSDRRWQRQRERKAAVISKLCTPQSFRNYFNDQIDEITSTLERVQAVVIESEEKGCEFDCCYEKVFADLLRRVETIGEMIIRVNQEINEGCDPCCGACR